MSAAARRKAAAREARETAKLLDEWGVVRRAATANGVASAPIFQRKLAARFGKKDVASNVDEVRLISLELLAELRVDLTDVELVVLFEERLILRFLPTKAVAERARREVRGRALA